MSLHNIHASDDFHEVSTKTIDERRRIFIGNLMKGYKRVKILKNSLGELLLQPVIEIPASEAWLFKNKKALKSVCEGLEDAEKGEISKLDLKSL